MRGQGIKDLRNGKPGDQYVHLDIKSPTSLNKKQKEALKSYKENMKESDDPYYKFQKNFKK